MHVCACVCEIERGRERESERESESEREMLLTPKALLNHEPKSTTTEKLSLALLCQTLNKQLCSSRKADC